MKRKLTSIKLMRVCITLLSALLVLTPMEAFTKSISANELQEQASLTASPWVSTQVYLGGNEVSYNNSVYRAKWWTQGDVPGSGDPSSSPWLLLGPDTGA